MSSKQFLNNFTQFFKPDGTLNSMRNHSGVRLKRALSSSPPESPNHERLFFFFFERNHKRFANSNKFAPNLDEECSDDEEEEIYRNEKFAKNQETGFV